MGFLDVVLDKEVDYGFEGGVRYKTNVSDNPNRFEERDSEWKYGKHEYEATLGIIPNDNRQAIMATFHVCKGRRHAFKFKDHNDFQIENQVIEVGTVDTVEPIQLYRRYEFGQGWQIRPIQCIKEITFVDESDMEVAGTWDFLTGVFTPDDPWTAQVYTVVYCEFYVWVRFDTDYNSMTINAWMDNQARLRLIEDPIDFFSLNVPNSWDE